MDKETGERFIQPAARQDHSLTEQYKNQDSGNEKEQPTVLRLVTHMISPSQTRSNVRGFIKAS
jgi:hypothetical protein